MLVMIKLYNNKTTKTVSNTSLYMLASAGSMECAHWDVKSMK